MPMLQCYTTVQCRQLLNVMDELNIGAFTVDIRRKVSAMNCTAQAFMGLKEAETLGKDCREVFVGIPCMIKCLFTNGGEWDSDYVDAATSRSTDSQRLVTRIATPIYDNVHQIAGCLTILQDHSPITDLINRVYYEERSLKMILENLDIGIFTVNRGGHITFFNARAEKITGYNRLQILGSPCSALMGNTPGCQDIDLLKESIQDGRTRISPEGQMRVAGGESIPIRSSIIALRNEKGTIVGGLVTFHDLSMMQQLSKAVSGQYVFHDMIGRDPAMQKIFHLAHVVASSDSTVLIEGPTGTGKDLLARIIHAESRRASKPFVKVNCAAMPDTLLESEMFGYVKGAFTGADRNKPGRFQEADGGAIFLDEIGDLPLSLQAKLLRVLEDRDFYPLGSRHPVKVDIRIISATNRGLEDLVSRRLFREDLFYRLNVLRIEIPPLKNRPSDIPLLIRRSLRRLSVENEKPLLTISNSAMDILLNYPYPGNVRELENILEHGVIISQSDTIQPEDLPDYVQSFRKKSLTDHPGVSTDQNTERNHIQSVLQNLNWNCTRAASELKMDRTTLWRKMKRLNLAKPRMN
ncbi:MAG: sigma 54-interacting transcriptional regulator [Desulfatirhabdiaceae bacterium]